MPRYVAFLRGVSPLNARMPDLRRCFEQAGFRNVASVLSSGNLAFDAPAAPLPALARRAEAAMQHGLDRSFATIVRRSDALHRLLAADPFAGFALAPDAKRVVTFLRAPVAAPLELPRGRDGAQLLAVVGSEAFTAYVPSAKGPVFMRLIEQALGRDVTTRTWETVRKCAAA
jgi:uncharacterized protein (DUF1697 family)